MRCIVVSILTLCGLLGVSVAHAQSTCENVKFGDSVTARFPNVRKACLDIVDKGGVQYALFKADLIRTARNKVWVRFKHGDGSRGETTAISVKPDFRVQVNKRPTRVENLAVGQELTGYARVTEPQIALVPAVDTDPLDLEPLPAVPSEANLQSAPSMPHTAGPLPGLGFLGLCLLGLGAAFSFVRIRARAASR